MQQCAEAQDITMNKIRYSNLEILFYGNSVAR